MMTAQEAREKLETESTLYKHIDEKITNLIDVAIKNGQGYIKYEVATDEEEPYWECNKVARCQIITKFVQKYGYVTATYADNKAVEIRW